MLSIKSISGNKSFWEATTEKLFVAHYNGQANTFAFHSMEALQNIIEVNLQNKGVLPTAIFKITRFKC